MSFIPRRSHARAWGEDDGALGLHKHPLITMMNGGGPVAVVSLFLRLLSISDGSSNGGAPVRPAFGQ